MEPLQYWSIVAFTLAGGLFSVAGAWRDWDFFFENRRARRFVGAVGRQGARWVYAVIGVVMVVIGIVFLLVGREPPTGP